MKPKTKSRVAKSEKSLSQSKRKFSVFTDLRFTGFITAGSSTSPINTISDLEGNQLGFTLDSFPDFARYQNIYDQIRVDSVRVNMTLTSAVGSTSQPPRVVQILYAYDPDGGTSDTRSIVSRNNMKMNTLSFSNPSMNISGIPGTLSSDGRVEKQLWYDIQGVGSKRFYLAKIVAQTDGFENDPSGAKLNLAGIITVFATFKGLR